MIETTLNISWNSYNKINNLSDLYKIQLKRVINSILHECIKNQIVHKKDPNLYKAVRYQTKKDPEQEWKIFHVCIPEYLYEACIDYRRLYKVSVSSVLERGIETYLDIVINNILCENQSDTHTDNYRINFQLKTHFNNNSTKLSYCGSIKIESG
ncbi:MAG: hypothetical protein KA015_01740 [Spirochaetes bacterium]|nr:hypothetical protein [Spirochaetota bacterium]